jgi:hypothetical protein
MSSPPPHHAYYLANHGQWRGPFELSVRPPEPGERVGFLDRMQSRFLALLFRLTGPGELRTVLDYRRRGPIEGIAEHWTWVRKWGVTLLLSYEEFALDPDGRTVHITGYQRAAPFIWRRHPYVDSAAQIDPAGGTMTYSMTVLGQRVHQVGQILQPGRVDIETRGPGYRSLARLTRIDSQVPRTDDAMPNSKG